MLNKVGHRLREIAPTVSSWGHTFLYKLQDGTNPICYFSPAEHAYCLHPCTELGKRVVPRLRESHLLTPAGREFTQPRDVKIAPESS